MAMPHFTPQSLPHAISKLLEMNNYEVKGPIQIHGAEIDLVARSKVDPFAAPIFIEATVEYVDNDKYGKDVGKLALVGEKEPSSHRIIVSSSGFSLPVKERAENTRILTLTYEELFRKFERFDGYVQLATGSGPVADSLRALTSIYEEPDFEDSHGKALATEFLTNWRDREEGAKKWLMVVGEYGTGKTALTRVLQHRWTLDYLKDPSRPIPFRIELRGFTRQFDARSLLHHFLDNNALSDLPIEFIFVSAL